jgi:hypothetical protein
MRNSFYLVVTVRTLLPWTAARERSFVARIVTRWTRPDSDAARLVGRWRRTAAGTKPVGGAVVTR